LSVKRVFSAIAFSRAGMVYCSATKSTKPLQALMALVVADVRYDRDQVALQEQTA